MRGFLGLDSFHCYMIFQSNSAKCPSFDHDLCQAIVGIVHLHDSAHNYTNSSIRSCTAAKIMLWQYYLQYFVLKLQYMFMLSEISKHIILWFHQIFIFFKQKCGISSIYYNNGVSSKYKGLELTTFKSHHAEWLLSYNTEWYIIIFTIFYHCINM